MNRGNRDPNLPRPWRIVGKRPFKTAAVSTAGSLAGLALTLAALVYVSLEAVRHWEVLSKNLSTPKAAITIAVTSVLYAASLIVLPLVWRTLVSSKAVITRRDAIRIYGQSQILKYLPSNVIQLAGRQLLGRRHGIGHLALMRASFLEICLMAAVALILASPVLIKHYPGLVAGGAAIAGGIICILVVAEIASPYARNIPRITRILSEFVSGVSKRSVLLAILSYAVFFVTTGMLVALISQIFGGPIAYSQKGLEIASYAVGAWLIGFVMPGAPGGLGIRETTFVVIAGSAIGYALALTVIVTFRIATILSDLALFVVVMVMPGIKTDLVDQPKDRLN